VRLGAGRICGGPSCRLHAPAQQIVSPFTSATPTRAARVQGLNSRTPRWYRISTAGALWGGQRADAARRQTDREPTKKWAHLVVLQHQRDVDAAGRGHYRHLAIGTRPARSRSATAAIIALMAFTQRFLARPRALYGATPAIARQTVIRPNIKLPNRISPANVQRATPSEVIYSR
jgi:hypothetical protein